MKISRRKLWIVVAILLAVLLAGMAAATYVSFREIRKLGQGPVWHIPSRFYSAPTTIVPGTNIGRLGLESRLKRLRYRPVKKVRNPGEYRKGEGAYTLYLHAFDYPDRRAAARLVRLELSGGRVKSIQDVKKAQEIYGVDIEPENFAEIFDQSYADRTVVDLKECPQVLRDAIIATEDRRFFKNWGVDLRSIFRALYVNLVSGHIVEGGSTITQQLVKNLFLTSERSVSRKLRETWLSLVMDAVYSKEEILGMYINQIYLGQWGNAGIYGFGRAARLYFDKDIHDLTLPEAAFLAGIIRAPNVYSPYRHPKAARERRNTVLKLMRDQGYIKPKAYRQAVKTPLGVAPFVPRTRHAPYFVDYIMASLDDSFPVDELSRGGYRIFTTLDMSMQLGVEARLAQGVANLGGAGLEGAVVMLDPQTGAIRAMAGGKSYAVSQFNRAVQMRRQIGSLVKPFVYYAAVKNGSTLTRFLDDSPYQLNTQDGKLWIPANYDNQNHGQVMLADALINSYNIATVRLGMDIGLGTVAGVIQDTLPGLKISRHPALLLGALDTSPLNVARMYAPFANMGKRVTPSALTAVAKGTTLLRRERAVAPVPVLSEDAVFLVDTCLQDVLRFGTGKQASAYGMPAGVCGKTGTTNDLRDAWFVGFTRDLVTVVWVGNDQYRPVNLSGATGALPIASQIMAAASLTPGLTPPADIVFCEVDPLNGKIASPLVEKRTMAFIKGSEPSEVSDRIPFGSSPDITQDVKEGADKVVGWFKSLF